MSKIFGVFGNPILHSKSPLMFNAALGNRGFYTRFKTLSGADIADAIKSIGLAGANVTAPFKEDILSFVDSQSEEVTLIGSTNTITSNNGRLKAYNTDWYGVITAIKQSGLELKGLKVALLGMGGAGKAAAYGLVKAGANVTLVNRTPSKAMFMADKLSCKWADISTLPELLLDSQLFISTIPSYEQAENTVHLPKGLWIFDANYHASTLTSIAKAAGNPIVDASQWLLYQGALAYEMLLNEQPPISVMQEAIGAKQLLPIKVVAICSCNSNNIKRLNDEVWIAPKQLALDSIRQLAPDLVIYSPKLTPVQVEELYHDERNKAFGS